MFPPNFTSQQEYDQYCRCLKRIKVGSEVAIYLRIDDGGVRKPSNDITYLISDPLVVVGTHYDTSLYDGGWNNKWKTRLS